MSKGDEFVERMVRVLDNLVSKARAAESAAATACQTASACEASIAADDALAEARSATEAELLIMFKGEVDTSMTLGMALDKRLAEVASLTRALDALLQALPEPQRTDLLKTALLAAARMP